MHVYEFTPEQHASVVRNLYPTWFKEAIVRYMKLKGVVGVDLDFPLTRVHTDFPKVIDHPCSVVIDGVECFATLPYNEVYPAALHMAAALGIELFTPRRTQGLLGDTYAFIHLYRPWAPWDGTQARAEGWDLQTCDKGFTMIVVAMPMPQPGVTEFVSDVFPHRLAAERFVFERANAGSAYHKEAAARITPSHLDPRPMELQLEEIRRDKAHHTTPNHGKST